MLWRDRPIEWRASRLKEMGFGVGLWNWPAWDLDALEKTGATFTIMNGYLEGRLTDAAGCEMLLASARQTVAVGKRLGVHRLNLHGTGESIAHCPSNGSTQSHEAAKLVAHFVCHS